MKTTRVDPDGTVRCPVCGATSFSEKRTGAAKWGIGVAGVATLGVGGLLGIAAAPKRLKCNGCGTNLMRSGGAPARPPGDEGAGPARPKALERVEKWSDELKAENERTASAIEDAKTRELGYLPDGVHPKSVRARQIRRAQEKAARERGSTGDA